MGSVTAVTLTLNEEEMIEGCLRSVAWADQIVVVDAGSTDRTVDIAQSLAGSVVTRQWTTWGDQKRFALSLARSDWVFWLDADERPSDELVAEIKRVVADPKDCAALSVPIRYRVLGAPLHYGGFRRRKPLLFRREGARWEGVVHTRLIPAAGRVARTSAPAEHLYIRDIERAIEKARRLAQFDANDDPGFAQRARRYDILWAPMRRLLGRLIIKGGILDGAPGIIAAGMLSLELFIAHAHLWQAGRFSSVSSETVVQDG